jgi:hypothetical protein
MITLETYKSFEEKENFFQFGGMKIDTIERFNHFTHLLMVQYSKGDFIFRGLSEAKYKLFNSAQRKWKEITNREDLSNESKYDDFIISLIGECKHWNSGTVNNLLKTYGISENNSIAYLSFMQHLGIPTPLMDFTKNPNKALFFAVNSIPEDFKESGDEIENYFSVYYTYQNNTAFEIFHTVMEKNRESRSSGEFDYLDLTRNSIILISDRKVEYQIVNNIRVTNQEGLFFFNNSPDMPIEEQYKTFANLLLEKIGREKFKKILAHETFSGCLNIHKKFVGHTKKLLNEMDITKAFIYPDISDLKSHIENIFTGYVSK